jgi:hypothetical protein
MTRSTYNTHNIQEWEDSFIRSGTKSRPVSRMLFRPEEMDSTSCVWPIFCPVSYRDINVTTYFIRALAFNDAVTNNDMYGLTAIQTRCIDLDRLTWKDPADRQGFKPSLRKPLLLSLNSNAILCGKVIKWRKRSD